MRRPSFDDVFMKIAGEISRRSEDPNTQVGAVIVDSYNRVISLGYNGLPGDMKLGSIKDVKDKNKYFLHAEENAILHTDDRSRLKGATCYVTLHPCHSCAKKLTQVGISRVVYGTYRHYPHAEHIFNSCGIQVQQYFNKENRNG